MLNTDRSKYNIPITLATDVILFLTMLVGLFRLRLGAGTFGLGRLLWTQVGRSLSLLVIPTPY